MDPPVTRATYAVGREKVREYAIKSYQHLFQLALDDRASRGDLEKHLKWLSRNVTAGGRVYLYFSGHGAPDATEHHEGDREDDKQLGEETQGRLLGLRCPHGVRHGEALIRRETPLRSGVGTRPAKAISAREFA